MADRDIRTYKLRGELGSVALDIGGSVDLLRSFELMFEDYSDYTAKLVKKAGRTAEAFDKSEDARLIRARFLDDIDDAVDHLNDIIGSLEAWLDLPPVPSDAEKASC